MVDDVKSGGEYWLLLGDCLERMSILPEKRVDMILCDPPYGTTACGWDAVIPFAGMWEGVRRVLRPDGAAVFTASQPFTSALVMSNANNFAHSWVWNKRFAANFVQAKRQPLKDHEDVVVFGNNGKQPNYFPLMLDREVPIKRGGNKPSKAIPIRQTETSELFSQQQKSYDKKFPTTTSLQFSSRDGRGLHPTQKPVALMEYLIKTYTNEGDVVLDFTMGSGTTGVACANLGRKFIGIEKDEEYFSLAAKRIEDAYASKRLLKELEEYG